MLTNNIEFKNFKNLKKNQKVLHILRNLKKNFFNKSDLLLLSLTQNYKFSFTHKQISKYKKYDFFKIIGMGGSILGSKAIYSFLKSKIKKKFEFINNLNLKKKNGRKKELNIIISKSGNTLETILNLNKLNKKK